MADILLLEPKYKNKYPPLGLMKISYFHKYILKDFVRFSKGELPESLKEKRWDRVYVTTLFTFEWTNTRKIIEYATSVAKDKSKIYVGGILATLMPNLIKEHFPYVNVIQGLLNKKGTLGLKGEEYIDALTPDYEILDDIKEDYIYPANDAYFLYMTRGCGMKCQFCAVQTLEPNYSPYISIKEIIHKIDKEFGPKKDLLLMDNNVLRSPNFDEIIDELKELGFSKNAKYINPKTGKVVQRFVDFNQGLDAFLLTPHKAKRLGELALRPARIAFDHIEDKEAYIKAIRLCADNGITHMSNYLLYNGDDFKGKGHNYKADTPVDLYNRMKISMDLRDEINSTTKNKVSIFSFPMRYIPLADTKRGYIGSCWNAKYLRALQIMLIPAQGKGVSTRSFFEVDFGKTAEEFVEYLNMPESILSIRGHFVEKKDEPGNIKSIRKRIWEENQLIIKEWFRLYRGLGDNKTKFLEYIQNNRFTIETLEQIEDPQQRKLYIHYLSTTTLLKSMTLSNENTKKFIEDYILREFPIIYNRIIKHIINNRIRWSLLEGFFVHFGEKFIKDIFNEINITEESNEYFLDCIIKVQNKSKKNIFAFELIKYVYIYNRAEIFNQSEIKNILNSIKNLDEVSLRKILISNIDKLRIYLNTINKGQAANDLIQREIEKSIRMLHTQLEL